jgi:hypothetical protein
VLAALDETWGTGVITDQFAPSLRHDAEFRRWVARYERAMGSPAAIVGITRANYLADVRAVLHDSGPDPGHPPLR